MGRPTMGQVASKYGSGDPYFGRSRNSRGSSGGRLLPAQPGRPQAQLDRLYRGLRSVRDAELGEDALQVPLDRREGEVQLLGYLAVGLARGDVAEDFRLPRRKRVGHPSP